jgi:transcriptional regulator with XRE-family HTH domain
VLEDGVVMPVTDRTGQVPTHELWMRLFEAPSIDRFLSDNVEACDMPTLPEYLLALCETCGMDPGQVARRADIERSYGNRLFSGMRHPSRDTVLQLAFGFGLTTDDQTKEKAMKALQDFLRPEFINRVDEIVYFNKLTEEHFRGIAALMLEELKEAMAARGMTLVWDEDVISALVKKSYSETYGARSLRRTIQKDIEDAVAEAVVARRAKSAAVTLTAPAGEIEIELA